MTNRAELETFDRLKYHEDCIKILEEKHWLPFLQKFNGNSDEVTKQFAFSFNGEKALVGNVSFRISEDTIAQSLGISPEGEKYFKTKQFRENSCTQFLSRSRVSSVNWKKGVPRSWLVHPWDEMVYIIQKFITCEGRYSIVYLYHIKLLLHLKGQRIINLPYFLLQSLNKMSKTIQKHKGNEDRSLYHNGLVKILIESELQRRGKTWKEFLIENQIEVRREEQEKQGSMELMIDVDEETPELKSSNIPQPSSSVRTRRQKQEASKRIERDEIFITYRRRSWRIKRCQTQDEPPEKNASIPMEIESSESAHEAEMETGRNEKEKEEPIPTNKKQKRLEKQIERLKEELMEANMLERVIKKENEMLKSQSKKIQQKNEKLKKKMKELKIDQTEICNWAIKCYNQKKILKEKYKNIKHQSQVQKNAQVQKNVDILLQAAEAQAETDFKGSTSGLA